MPLPFGSRTIGVLIRAIAQACSDTEIGTLLLEAGAQPWAPEQWPSKQRRLQWLFARMSEDTSVDVENAALELVRLLLRKDSLGQAAWWSEVRAAMASDGWEYDVINERLAPTIPGMRVAQETTQLELELDRRGWSTAGGHYRQALDAFAAGRWASANSQLRSLLEELIPAAAESVSGRRPKEVQASLDALRKAKVLVEGEYGLAKGAMGAGPATWPASRPERRGGVTVPTHDRDRLLPIPARTSTDVNDPLDSLIQPFTGEENVGSARYRTGVSGAV